MSSPTNRWAARNAPALSGPGLNAQIPQGRRPSGTVTAPPYVGRPQNPTMARPTHGRTPSTSALPVLPTKPGQSARPRVPSGQPAAGTAGVPSAGAGAIGGTGSVVTVQNGVTEQSPLLPKPPRMHMHTLDGLNKPATTWTEFGVLARSSVSLSAGLMLENALSTINILIVTTLGESHSLAQEGAVDV